MPEVRELLREGLGGFHPLPDAYERTLRKVRRRQRTRRFGAGLVAVSFFGAALAGLWVGFTGTEDHDGTGTLPLALTRVLHIGATATDIAVGEVAAWVPTVDQPQETLVRIDADTNRIDATTPLFGHSDSRLVAVGEDAVWVANAFPGRSHVARIDPATSEFIDTIGLESTCELIYDIAAGEGAVWVAGLSGGSQIYRINPQTNEVEAVIRVGGDEPVHVAVGEGAVWVSSTLSPPGESNSLLISRIDPRTNQVIARIPISISGPTSSLAVGEGGVWVARQVGHRGPVPEEVRVVRIDPHTNERSVPISIAGVGGGITAGEGAVWLPTNNGKLWQIDPRNLRLAGRPFSFDDGGNYNASVGLGAVWILDDQTVFRIDVGCDGDSCPASTG